jgi:hypothetical protein
VGLVHGKGTEPWILVVFLTEVSQRRAFRQAQNGFETTFIARQTVGLIHENAEILGTCFIPPAEVFKRTLSAGENCFEDVCSSPDCWVGSRNAETLDTRFISSIEVFKRRSLLAGENCFEDICSPPDCWVD